MSLRQAAQQALEALKIEQAALEYEHGKVEHIENAITALRAALAEPGNDYERGFVDGMSHQAKSSVDRAVNAMARKPLTDEEILRISLETPVDLYAFAHAIERAHGIGGEE
jgi:hypothetical protein